MFVNKSIIYGNLTRDPETKALPSGQAVCSFSLATNRTWKGKDGQKKESAEFHNCVAFGRTAELIAQYMTKGSGLFIEGRLQTRNWEKDGTKHYRTEIVVESMQFGPSKGQQPAAPKKEKVEVQSEDIPVIEEGNDTGEIDIKDIPF